MVHDIAKEIEKLADDLGIDRKRSIGDVAKELKVQTHIIRFWEEKFPQIQPEIGAGKRRYYYNKQIKVLKRIKKFLYEEGYTISGLQKMLKKRKQDGYKEEDLDVILQGNDNFIEHDMIAEKKQHDSLSYDAKSEIESLLNNIKINLDKLRKVACHSIL